MLWFRSEQETEGRERTMDELQVVMAKKNAKNVSMHARPNASRKNKHFSGVKFQIREKKYS